jgi:hypothetical protein
LGFEGLKLVDLALLFGLIEVVIGDDSRLIVVVIYVGLDEGGTQWR